MDHKRGYPYDYLEDQAMPSPTKRLKDLSHHRDDQSHRGHVAPDAHTWSDGSRANPQLGERYNAELHRSQYKTQIQFGCPQASGHGRGTQPCPAPDPDADAPVPPHPPIWSGVNIRSASSLEMKMEEVAYNSMLPLVKKELENWAFGGNHRAQKRMPACNDEPDDETTCAVCRNPRKFKGWDALLIHAQKYNKQMPWQHRGYYRALQEALYDKKVQNQNYAAEATADPPSPGKCTDDIKHHQTEARQQTEKNEPWRPDILIVENEEFHEVGHILKQQPEAGKPNLREVLAVYTNGEGDDQQRHVFVYPASKVGYVGENDVTNKGSKLAWQAEETCRDDADEMETSVSEQLTVKKTSKIMSNDVATRCESLKEALGLQLTLDDPDDIPGKKLFDLDQIHRTSRVMDRWVENFRSSAQGFEMQRVFRESPQLVAIDEGFRADLKRTRTYSPTCKRKIKEHMAQIEDHFREGHLMWLQQVEQVRDQFQELADQVQHKEAYNKFYKMRAEIQASKQMWKHEKEEVHNALREAQEKAIHVVRRRKLKQRQERAHLMHVWMEDAKVFKQESTKAREERRRLQKIHDKVHDRAEFARPIRLEETESNLMKLNHILDLCRKDCPVCLESFRVSNLDSACECA